MTLGARGNSVGSAGGSNYSGDGHGGQVNMDHVGGSSGNVLRSINGTWTIVDKETGAPKDPNTGAALSRATPAAYTAPAVPTPAPKPALPAAVPVPRAKPALPASVPLDPQIAGRAQAAAATHAAQVATTMQTRSAREDAIAGATHNMVETHLNNTNPTLGNQDRSVQYGTGTAPRSTVTRNVDASLPGRAAEAARSEQARVTNELRTQGVPGGAGVVAFEAGPARSPTAPQNPFDAVFDPQIAGRLAATRAPGYGVPDLPTRGQTVNMTPAAKPAVAASNPALQALNDMIHRQSQLAYAGTTAAETPPSPSLGAPQPAGPEGQAPGVVSTNPSVPIPREKPTVAIGEALRALTPPAKMQERARPENPVENAAIPGQVGTVLSQGLPQMVAAPETAQQKLASIMHQWTAAQAANNARHVYTAQGDLRTLDPGVVESVGMEPTSSASVGSPENKPPVGTNAPTATPAPIAGSDMFSNIGKAISGAVDEGMGQFHIASEQIDKMGGPEVVSGLSRFVQTLNVSPGQLGTGGKGNSRGDTTGNSKGGGTTTPPAGSDAYGHQTADYTGKGFTDAEVAKLIKLTGSNYTKELARLIALHKTQPGTGDETNFAAILKQYNLDRERILAGNGHGLIPI